MFIVSCYGAVKMNGIQGAQVERPGSSGKYAGVPRAGMDNTWFCQ